MKFYREAKLSEKAEELVQFDEDSIKQLAASEHDAFPETWLADPDEYEKNGRVLRDSSLPRMLAYSAKSHTLYATDGCNSCVRRLPAALTALSEDQLHSFAKDNELRIELLKRLALLNAA